MQNLIIKYKVYKSVDVVKRDLAKVVMNLSASFIMPKMFIVGKNLNAARTSQRFKLCFNSLEAK